MSYARVLGSDAGPVPVDPSTPQQAPVNPTHDEGWFSRENLLAVGLFGAWFGAFGYAGYKLGGWTGVVVSPAVAIAPILMFGNR